LGDRIAIMAEGQLRCVGSSLFLKKTYGVGYQLTIERLNAKHLEPSATAEDGLSKDVSDIAPSNNSKLQSIVTSAVEEAVLLSDVGSEMSFRLPVGAAPKFAPMFEDLDKEIDSGTVSSYGVSITTLEEVFLLIARGETSTRDGFSSVRNTAEDSESEPWRSRMDLKRDSLFSTHLRALFGKRVSNFRRDKKAWVCTTILPSLFVLVGFIIFKFASPYRDLEPIPLDLSGYNAKVKTGPKNPIPFNAPEEVPFLCQPGKCAYQKPIMFNPEFDELYYFCGYKGRLSESPNCSISESTAVVDRLVGDGVTAEPTVVGDISQASHSLAATSNLYAASQYGAIFFSHELDSMVDGGTSYNATVVSACERRSGNYTSSRSCEVFGGIGYVIQYNFTALHVAPLYQQLADEALVREALDTDEINIRLTIDPLPITDVEIKLKSSEDAYSAWFLVILSFPFIAGAFGTFVVSERQSKAKHLQTVAGVKPSAYWISTYMWDVLNYQIPFLVTVVLMFAFGIQVLTTTDQDIVSGVIVVLFLFGPAAAGFTYCVSFAFTSAALCNVVVIIGGFLVGMGGTLTTFILLLLGNDPFDRKQHLINASVILTWVLRFFPPFCLANGLFRVINIQIISLLEGEKLSAWTEPVLLYDVIFLAWESVIYLALAICLDKWSTNPRIVSYWQNCVGFITCKQMRWSKGRVASEAGDSVTPLPEDDDVLAEQERIINGEAESDLIVLRQLTKKYGNQKLAVDNISLGIPPGECFGLLGINGKCIPGSVLKNIRYIHYPTNT